MRIIVFCPYCGFEVLNAEYCPNCGADILQKRLEKRKIKEVTNFHAYPPTYVKKQPVIDKYHKILFNSSTTSFLKDY